MTNQDFVNKYNGKGINFDGYYGNQCMDLWQQYNKEVVGAPAIPAAVAKLVWLNNAYPLGYYTKVANTPTNIPVAGDVVIWDGTAGHIAVFQTGDVMKFTSFDQNYPSQGYYDKYGNFIGTGVCHLQTHNYNNVLGWLHPHAPAAPLTPREDKIKTIVYGSDSDTIKVIKIRELF